MLGIKVGATLFKMIQYGVFCLQTESLTWYSLLLEFFGKPGRAHMFVSIFETEGEHTTLEPLQREGGDHMGTDVDWGRSLLHDVKLPVGSIPPQNRKKRSLTQKEGR